VAPLYPGDDITDEDASGRCAGAASSSSSVAPKVRSQPPSLIAAGLVPASTIRG
jgi:hypothetical protein